MLRLLVAIFVAPFLVTVIVVLMGIGGERFETVMFTPFVHPAVTVLMMTPIVLAIVALGGWLKRPQWYWAGAGGAVLGILLFGPMFWATVADDRLLNWKRLDALITLGGFVAYTVLVVLVAWGLGIWRNPRFRSKVERSGDAA